MMVQRGITESRSTVCHLVQIITLNTEVSCDTEMNLV